MPSPDSLFHSSPQPPLYNQQVWAKSKEQLFPPEHLFHIFASALQLEKHQLKPSRRSLVMHGAVCGLLALEQISFATEKVT